MTGHNTAEYLNAAGSTGGELLDFLAKCPTPFHTADTIRKVLLECGYTELGESQPWILSPGGRYFALRGGSSIIAFRIPRTDPSGFMIAASHSDSPALKIKVNPEMKGNGYVKLNVEKYGGIMLSSWFDRPLSVAGRVVVRVPGGLESRLVRVDRDLVLIPRLAIHMDRTQNDGKALNPQVDMLPLLGQESSAGSFMKIIAQEAGCAPEDILGHDLFLYVRGRGTVWGAENEFLSAPHLDDLQCGFANLKGFLRAGEGASIPVLALFDNEEIGSRTRQGADSTFLIDMIRRISASLSWDNERLLRAFSRSFVLSADNAHAVHPNYPDKADPVNRPQMNRGIVLKYSAVHKYTTDGLSAAVFKEICRIAGVPYQEFTNRSDIPGGSTLGYISTAHVSVLSVDIGLAQLAMHSSFETAGTSDTGYLERAAEVFFSSSLESDGEKIRIIR